MSCHEPIVQGIDFEFEDTWMSTNYDFNPYQTEISKLEVNPLHVYTDTCTYVPLTLRHFHHWW